MLVEVLGFEHVTPVSRIISTPRHDNSKSFLEGPHFVAMLAQVMVPSALGRVFHCWALSEPMADWDQMEQPRARMLGIRKVHFGPDEMAIPRANPRANPKATPRHYCTPCQLFVSSGAPPTPSVQPPCPRCGCNMQVRPFFPGRPNGDRSDGIFYEFM